MEDDEPELPDALKGLEGLPREVINEIIRSTRLSFFSFLGNWLFMIVMLSDFVFGYIGIWLPLETLANSHAETFASTVDGFAATTNIGLGLVIGLFTWIVFSNVIVALVIRMAPMPVKAALYYSGRSEIEQDVPKFMKRWSEPDNFDRPVNASNAINSKLSPYIRKTTFLTLPFFLLAAIICEREARSFEIFAASGFYSARILSAGVEHLPWSTASSVELGCNNVEGHGSLIYNIGFQDGTDVYLPDETSLNGQSWFENLEAVDQTLRSTDAAFKRWTWMKRDPLHPTCLRGFYAELGPENKPRLDRLLRIGEFKTDQRPAP